MSPQTSRTEEQTEKGFIEYLGSQPYGTEFEDTRLITRKQARDAWDVSIPKDLRWDKATTGKNKGRLLLPLADVPVEVRDLLLEDKAFKVVEE